MQPVLRRAVAAAATAATAAAPSVAARALSSSRVHALSSCGWTPVRCASSAAAGAGAAKPSSPQAATPAPGAERPRPSAADADPYQSAFVPYAPVVRTEMPPVELPNFVTRVLDRLRGTSYAEFHSRAYCVYNSARAHPLATPNPEELQLMRQNHTLQLQDAKSMGKAWQVPPFVPPATRLLALGLGDDELTRLRLIAVHVWLMVTAMQRSVAGADALHRWGHMQPPSDVELADAQGGRGRLNSEQRRLIGRIYELLWHEMTPFLQATHGELKVSSTLRNTVQHWYGNFLALDVAWQEACAPGSLEAAAAAAAPAAAPAAPAAAAAAGGKPAPAGVVAARPPRGMEALAAEVWRIFWLGDVRARKRDVFVLTTYLVLQARQLSQYSEEQLWHGREAHWSLQALAKHSLPGEEMMSQVLGLPKKAWQNNDYASWKITILDENMSLSFKGN